MTDTPQFLAERLKAEGEKSVTFFNEMPPDQWERTVYTEGTCWTVHQVLAHFVATESSIERLMRNILGGGSGAPEDFNIDAYNERKVAAIQDSSPDELLDEFQRLRAGMVTFVAGLSPEDLTRKGRHPWLGETELVEVVKLLYRHNQIHQRDVRKLIG